MSSISAEQPCPCGSGVAFGDCCGAPGRTAVNAAVVARISCDGTVSPPLATAELRAALESITRYPDLFPARLNLLENKAFLVKMSARWYRDSVFLDPARMRGSYVLEADPGWLLNVAQSVPLRPTAYIFHTAFCGSTLMVHALDALFQCLPLREPEVLGNVLFWTSQPNIPTTEINNWLDAARRLLSRTYEAEQMAVIKANDYANPLMGKLLHLPAPPPMLFMYAPLGEFVVACLKAANRREWIRGRFKSVVRHPAPLSLPPDYSLPDDSLAEMAAVYWSYNISLYLEAARSSSTKLCSLDFNAMLSRAQQATEACGRAFGLKPRSDASADASIRNLLSVYSKNSDFSYGPQQRARELENLSKKFASEVISATRCARELLGDKYPEGPLSGALAF